MLAFARRRTAAATEGVVVAVLIGFIAALLGLVSPSLAATTYVTPEGATIVIDSRGPWTAEDIHRMLLENGLDAVIGPTLTVKVQDASPSQTSTSVSKVGGEYQDFQAVMYLKGVDSNFVAMPDAILAHELGHAWSLYHLYMTQAKDWTSYLSFRGILGDPRVDSSYNWSKSEMIADDYRVVMGSARARSQMPGYINADVAHPSTIDGFRDFFVTIWARASISPAPTAAPSVTPTAPPSTAAPTLTPSPTAEASATPTSTASPTPTPTASPMPTPTPTASPTPTPTPTPVTGVTPNGQLVTKLTAAPQVVRKSTQISFEVATSANVNVVILDASGAPIRTLATGPMASGGVSLLWNRTDDKGRRVAKGTYRVEVHSWSASATDSDSLSLTAQ